MPGRTIKILARILLALVAVAGAALLALWLIGIPEPGTFTTEGVPRVSLRHLFAVTSGMPAGPGPVSLIGFGTQDRLVIASGSRELTAIDADGSNVPLGYVLPPPAYGSSAAPLGEGLDLWLLLQERNLLEDRDLVRIDLATGAQEVLLAGRSSVTSFAVAPDGSFVLCFNEDHDSGAGTLYRVPLQGPAEPVAVTTFKGLAQIQCLDASLTHAFVLQSANEQDGRLYRVDLQTGAALLEFPVEAQRRFFHGTEFTWYSRHRRFLLTSDDHTGYYVRTALDARDQVSEFAVLHEVDLRSRQLRQVSPDLQGDVGHIALTRDERYLVFLVLERGFARLMALDRQDGTCKQLYGRPGETVEWISDNTPFLLHPRENKVYFQSVSATQTRLLEVEIGSGIERRLDPDPAPPAPERVSFGVVVYPTTEPRIGSMEGIQAFLYKPSAQSAGRLPVMVDFHGGPDTLATPYAPRMSSMFLDRGFAVLVPNYRGSAGFGVTFEQADDQLDRPRQLEDVKALVDWIETQPDLDSRKILLMGHSWGGTMVLASMARYPDLFLAGISICPETLDPDPDPQQAPGLLRGWRKSEIGDPADPALRAVLESVSPVTNAHRIQQPLLILQGAQDARVSVASVRKVKDGIAASGGQVWYVEAADSGHAFSPGGPLQALYTFGVLMEFVERAIEAR